MGKTGDAFFTGGEQLLAGKFRRGVQIKRRGVAGRRQALRGESMQMRLIAGEICNVAVSTSRKSALAK